jgi:hypothetical protein
MGSSGLLAVLGQAGQLAGPASPGHGTGSKALLRRILLFPLASSPWFPGSPSGSFPAR